MLMMLMLSMMIPVVTANPIINEIMYNPTSQMGDDSDYEWIEIFNPDNISLENWVLELGGRTMILPDTDVEYLVIAREAIDGPDADHDCFTCYYDVPAIDGPAWTLSNTAGIITLCSPDLLYCDSVEYKDDWGGDGDGSSLEWSGIWQPSTDTDAVFSAGKSDGTPGYRNSASSASPVPEFSSLTAIFVLLGVMIIMAKKRVV